MNPKAFLHTLAEDQIVAAIAAAEQRTAGEIRVFVSHAAVPDALLEARKQFAALAMEQTRDRSGVLIFVAPASQQFAVVGDAGVHARCGDEFWKRIAQDLAEGFKRGAYTEALTTAIESITELLARHFPRRPDDQNELPNTIVRG